MELKTTRVTVSEVINGTSFKVSPQWATKTDEKGDIIEINGFNAPQEGQPGYEEAKKNLSAIILGKSVELGNPTRARHGQITCDVKMEGRNLTTFLTK